jgi:pyruvate/2-oxoglutarate dehydrogenase complex dihydrolipoamide acyltransferase (E2) component
VAVNAVTEAPVIENGEVKVGKVMNLNFSVDHRFVDGGRAK